MFKNSIRYHYVTISISTTSIESKPPIDSTKIEPSSSGRLRGRRLVMEIVRIQSTLDVRGGTGRHQMIKGDLTCTLSGKCDLMLCIYINIRGLGKPSKILALKRLIDIHNLDILLLQETLLTISDFILFKLENFLPRWDFICLDAMG